MVFEEIVFITSKNESNLYPNLNSNFSSAFHIHTLHVNIDENNTIFEYCDLQNLLIENLVIEVSVMVNLFDYLLQFENSAIRSIYVVLHYKINEDDINKLIDFFPRLAEIVLLNSHKDTIESIRGVNLIQTIQKHINTKNKFKIHQKLYFEAHEKNPFFLW